MILPPSSLIKPNIDLQSKDELYCREYMNYELIDKGQRRREDQVKTMLKGCMVLDELGVKYALSRGTALGLGRDNDFLPLDIDIDLDVFGDEDIYKILKAMPFEELFVTHNKGHYQQFAFWDKETTVIFDISFFHQHEARWNNRNYFGYYWLPHELVSNLAAIEVEEYFYPIYNLDWYCEFWYGPNWRTPKKYGQDWSIDYRTDCKGFIYTGEKDIIYEKFFS
jgi:hypothetical protein